MKITGNVNSIVSRRTTQNNLATQKGTGGINPLKTGNTQNNTRSLSEALSISQMSQSIVQKALVLASQLQGIATKSFATGRVNTAELADIVATANSTYENYGTQIQPIAEKIILPEISSTTTEKDLKDLKDLANKPIAGEDYLQEVNEVISGIQNNKKDIDQAVLKLEKILGIKSKKQDFPNEKINNFLKKEIATNHLGAFDAQGNILPENVKKLFI